MSHPPTEFEQYTHASFQDCRIVVVGGVEFTISATYIALYSDFFKVLFFGDFREANETRVTLEEITPENFRSFLDAIYPCHKDFTAEEAVSLMELAYRFQVPYLLKSCEEKLLGAVRLGTMSPLLPVEVAFKHNSIEGCVRFLQIQPTFAGLLQTISNSTVARKKFKELDNTLKMWIFEYYASKYIP